MATTLGDATDAATPAQRVRRPGWRDPRLWIGVVLVAGSVVAGARLLAAADDTVQVWAAATDLGAGARADRGGPGRGPRAVRRRGHPGRLLHGRRRAARRPPARARARRRRAGAAHRRRVGRGQRAGRGADRGRARAGAVVRGDRVGGRRLRRRRPRPRGRGRPRRRPPTGRRWPASRSSTPPRWRSRSARPAVVSSSSPCPRPTRRRFFALLGSYDTAVLTVVRRG